MKIAFTLCSINYLPQAKTLGDSLIRYNPDYRFIIGLVDRVEDPAQLSFVSHFEVTEAEKLDIEGFEQMYQYYSLVELNTAVKPFYMAWLLKRFPDAEFVVYLDPDILICNRMTALEEKLLDHNVVLTPHTITPINWITPIDKMTPFFPERMEHYEERVMLYVGIFNLGFIAVRNTKEGMRCINWWGERLRHQCYVGGSKNFLGLFTDQVWMNFAPIYFENVHIFKHIGYNMAPWNLHERKIVARDNTFYVNDMETPLVFFHFSGYNYDRPEMVTKWTTYTLTERIDLQTLFTQYRNLVTDNQYTTYRSQECFFIRKKRLEKEQELRAKEIKVTFANQPLRASFRAIKKIIPSPVKKLIKKPIAFLYRLSHPQGS